MTRFVFLAVVLLMLLQGLFAFGADYLRVDGGREALAAYGVARPGSPPEVLTLGVWVLEALGLTALFLLIQGRGGAWWLDGLLTGWIAWIFRGPLLVLTVEALTRLPRDPWWGIAVRTFFLYSCGGLLLAELARRLDLRR
ncbi:MAG: hypothetical protein ACM3OB_09275 [Acidobacteriota bacterium]